LETAIIILEKKIIKDCLLSDVLLIDHCDFTNPESLKDPFVKKIFKSIQDLYFSDEKVDMKSLFYKLPVETRRGDLQKIMELML